MVRELVSILELKEHADASCAALKVFISQKVFIKLFFKIQFPHESVNLFFISVVIKDKLTNLCRN